MTLKRFLVAPLLFFIACNTPTPAEEMDSAVSWLGTAVMAGDAWLRHTTPDKYTRETLRLSERTLRQIADHLLKSPPSGIDSASLDSALTLSRGRIARMAGFVGARNSPGFASELAALRENQASARRISDKIKPKQ